MRKLCVMALSLCLPGIAFGQGFTGAPPQGMGFMGGGFQGPPPEAFTGGGFMGGPYSPYSPQFTLHPDPRKRRAAREQIIGQTGAISRSLVEHYGEAAVAALAMCSQSVRNRLCEAHNSGRLSKVCQAPELLWAIAHKDNGDDVAIFALEHMRELSDPSAMQAYLEHPLEVALGLCDLDTSAAEVRARRIAGAVAPPPAPASPPPPASTLPAWQFSPGNYDGRVVGVIVGAIAILLLYWWRKRRT